MNHPPRHQDRRRKRTRQPAPRRTSRLGSLIALIAVVLSTACSASDEFSGDSFSDFAPTRDLFPAPPVDNAREEMGFLSPPDFLGGCPSWVGPFGGSAAYGDWTGVRYRWTEDGHAAIWAISARTTSLTEFTPEVTLARYQKFVESCTEKIDDLVEAKSIPQASMRRLQLDGLPEGSIAFELTYEGQTDLGPRPMQIYGAVVVAGATGEDAARYTASDTGLPYNDTDDMEPTHALTVAWVATSTDVPPDGFVATVNSMSKAANEE